MEFTSFHGDVINTNYNALVAAFGKPSEVDFDKSQCEWELTTPNGTTFYIYDWKEYLIDVRTAKNVQWHIGRGESASDIKEYLESKGFSVEKSTWW